MHRATKSHSYDIKQRLIEALLYAQVDDWIPTTIYDGYAQHPWQSL